jgi:hypothetical protein
LRQPSCRAFFQLIDEPASALILGADFPHANAAARSLGDRPVPAAEQLPADKPLRR